MGVPCDASLQDVNLVTEMLNDQPQTGRVIIIGMGTGYFTQVLAVECLRRNKPFHVIDEDYSGDYGTRRVIERCAGIIHRDDPTDFMMRNQLIETFISKCPLIVLNKHVEDMILHLVPNMRTGSVLMLKGRYEALDGNENLDAYRRESWSGYSVYVVK